MKTHSVNWETYLELSCAKPNHVYILVIASQHLVCQEREFLAMTNVEINCFVSFSLLGYLIRNNPCFIWSLSQYCYNQNIKYIIVFGGPWMDIIKVHLFLNITAKSYQIKMIVCIVKLPKCWWNLHLRFSSRQAIWYLAENSLKIYCFFKFIYCICILYIQGA